jgi:hypothetical protein
MKTLALLFIAAWTFGLPLCALKAQETVSTVIIQKKGKAVDRARLRAALRLLNNRNGTVMGKDLISMEKALKAKGITYPGSLNEITSAVLKQMLKKLSRPMTGTAQVYLIDTAIVYSTTDTERYSYSYNASGIAISSLEEVWQNGQWTNYLLETMTYDASGNELTDLAKNWQNGQWTNSSCDTMTYDTSGNELTSLADDWLNGQLTNNERNTYTYDTSGHQLTFLTELWNGHWTNYSLITHTYDGNELTDSLYETWQNGQWTNYIRDIYTYDASGNKLTCLYDYWQNGQWGNAGVDSMAYDASGHELTRLEKEWQNGQLTNTYFDTMTYDANGNELTYLAKNWQNGQWTNGGLWSYTYDASGHLLNYLYTYWQNGQWTNNWRNTYTYDANQNLIAYSSRSRQDSAWVASEGYVGLEDYVGVSNGPNYEVYRGSDVTIAYKLTDVTGISASKPDVPTGFSLSQNYPNPFNPTTVINYQLPANSFVTLKVYDILGREVATLVNEMQSEGEYSTKFDGSKFSSGVYLYRLEAVRSDGERFVATNRMVLIK